MIRADPAEGLGDDVWTPKLGGSLEAMWCRMQQFHQCASGGKLAVVI